MGAGRRVAAHVDDRPGLRLELDGPEGAMVDRAVRIEGRLDRHEDAGPHGRERGVHDARRLRARAFEVGEDPVATLDQVEPHQHGVEAPGVEQLEVILEDVFTVGQPGDALPHPRLGAVQVRRDGVHDNVAAEPLDQLQDALAGDPAGAEARVQVAQALVRQAHVGQQKRLHALHELAAFIKLDRRDADAFLKDRGGLARIAARRHAADVRPVRAHGGEKDELAVMERRHQQAHVVEVRAAAVGVVHQDDVAGGEFVAEVLTWRRARSRASA